MSEVKITIQDLGLLLNEAYKQNCEVKLDDKDPCTLRYCEVNKVLVVEHYDWEYAKKYNEKHITVCIHNYGISIYKNGFIEHEIRMYKNKLTKEEYLTTLEFLKND